MPISPRERTLRPFICSSSVIGSLVLQMIG
ncbi:hypothetical protein R2601_03528 [Salipiger bermudensis HTCC2601]|uniref:Uncharacterized protein n=1 Tax=Salipiger bermudensis (strain DSM 26914 / JCM 13377 / KCTC 12554 / HTCC2601) TaxID=314265 RepID=Q0FWE0_SALBH|nr:hypothetical protein R2601_03528 [Salipiger bermudensis HTCC2601]